MQYSVEQIRSVRNNYLEPPYPGFSIDEVCRRRRMAQTKLVRGENAWSAKGTAQTTEEWVQRLVQGSLNKMSEKNYDAIMTKLRAKELFATPEMMRNVVSIIFQKALDEPENSKLYAGVCNSLAMFEISLESDSAERGKSELRSAIIHTAQQEFRVYRHEETEDDKKLSDEDREFLRANFMRRKKANIRFVGELFLYSVLSTGTIISIIEVVLKAAIAGGYPEPENIELFAELCETIGETFDKQQKQRMDQYFTLLAKLIKSADNPYPHRIRFKIMDLIDLRRSAWGTKPKVVKASAKKSTGAASPFSSTSKKGKNDAGSWRDMANKKDQSPTSSSAVDRNGKGAKRGVAASPTAAGAAGPPGVTPSSSLASRAAEAAPESPMTASPQKVVKFELRVHSMFHEWVADCSNDFIPKWIDEFSNCDREFNSEQELCVAVAMEVVKEACTTTRKEAQREACSFLIVGLFLVDEEMFRGFAGALAAAMDDGLLEDVPRFPERLMNMVHISSTEVDINADVYYDAVNVLCMAYNLLAEPDEFTVDTLMEFWAKVSQPLPETDEENRVILGYPVIYTLCEQPDAKPGLEKLISRIIDSLHSMGIVEDDAIDEMLTVEAEQNPLFPKIVEEYKLLNSGARA